MFEMTPLTEETHSFGAIEAWALTLTLLLARWTVLGRPLTLPTCVTHRQGSLAYELPWRRSR